MRISNNPRFKNGLVAGAAISILISLSPIQSVQAVSVTSKQIQLIENNYSADPAGLKCSMAVGRHRKFLKPRSEALYGEDTNVYIRTQNRLNLVMSYILYKKDHYYPWRKVEWVLTDCTRDDLLQWMKGKISTAGSMSDYAYIGSFTKVGLRGEPAATILKAWCNLIPQKQKEVMKLWKQGAIPFDPNPSSLPLRACR